MNSKTAIEAISKILEQTKSDLIKWEVLSKYSGNTPFRNTAYSYTAKTNQGRMFLGKPTYDSSNCSFFINPANGPMYDFSDFISWYDNESRKKYTAYVNELFSYVYNSLPNADTFINSFLEE